MLQKRLAWFSRSPRLPGTLGSGARRIPRCRRSDEIRYRKGAYIWRPEGAANSLYWLQQGQVVELRGPSASKIVITRVVVPGEPFGHRRVAANSMKRYSSDFELLQRS